MSEGSFTPPPPPPPPPAAPGLPPPPPPTGLPPTSHLTPTGFDFVKPFTYVFEDPRWLNKIGIGALFYLAGFVIVGWFFLFGYCAQLARNVAAGMANPLPEWDELGEYFGEGLRLFGVMICYMLPLIILLGIFMVPIIMTAATVHDENEAIGAIMSGMTGCVWFLFALAGMVMTFFVPASLLMVVAEKRFSAAFELGKIWSFITANIGNYLLAIVVYLIARFLGGFGIILCCVGVLFTGFWALLVTTHGFGQVWKLSARK
jgi:hypothetical protein